MKDYQGCSEDFPGKENVWMHKQMNVHDIIEKFRRKVSSALSKRHVYVSMYQAAI